MKISLLIFFYLLFTGWHYSLDEAKQIATQEHKYILLNFSGSDWCGPCIRMHKEIFDDPDFSKMADSELVMVNADFPRMKKNQLSKEQQKLNNEMADRYNAKGAFPYTVLLNADGKVLKEWDGFPNESAYEFADEVKNVIDSNR